MPVVLCGDFNSLAVKLVPDEYDRVESFPVGGQRSGAYTLVTTGSLSPDHPEHPHSRCTASGLGPLVSPLPPLTSAYVRANGREPELTTKVLDFQGTIDFVFVSDNIDVKGTLDMPYSSANVADFPCIPTSQWPSDHLALGCNLEF